MEKQETCKWYRGQSFGFRSYQTECGHDSNIYDPKMQVPKICPYCNKPVEPEK